MQSRFVHKDYPKIHSHDFADVAFKTIKNYKSLYKLLRSQSGDARTNSASQSAVIKGIENIRISPLGPDIVTIWPPRSRIGRGLRSRSNHSASAPIPGCIQGGEMGTGWFFIPDNASIDIFWLRDDSRE